MAKFVYLYSGGQVAESVEAQEEEMRAWGAWFGSLGDSVVDMGNPFSGGSSVSAAGSAPGGATSVGGYSILSADSLVEAAAKAEGCPVIRSGGSVDVYEAVPM